MSGLPTSLSVFRNEFNKFNNTGGGGRSTLKEFFELQVVRVLDRQKFQEEIKRLVTNG